MVGSFKLTHYRARGDSGVGRDPVLEHPGDVANGGRA